MTAPEVIKLHYKYNTNELLNEDIIDYKLLLDKKI